MPNENGIIDMDDNGQNEEFDMDALFGGDDDESNGEPLGDEHFHGLDDLKPAEPEEEEESQPEEAQPPVIEEPAKKVDQRTPEQLEQDRQNAERRRQSEARKAQEALEKSPEYALTKMLKEMYGVADTNEMLNKIREANLARQAQAQNVPVEMIRKQVDQDARIAQQEATLRQLEFNAWNARIESEKAALKGTYPTLTDEDLDQAQHHLLDVFGNPNVPLSQAVMALHGDKIMKSIQESAKNDALAAISGRQAQSVPTPPNSNPNVADALTEEEKRVARNMGLTEAEYKKWK